MKWTRLAQHRFQGNSQNWSRSRSRSRSCCTGDEERPTSGHTLRPISRISPKPTFELLFGYFFLFVAVSETASAKKTASAIVSVSTMWGRYWNSVSASLSEREFCWVLQVRVASGVDAEFPYRVRIVDRGLIAATLFGGLPRKQKSAWKLLGSRVKKVNWIGMPTIRCVNSGREFFAGAWSPEKKAEKFAIKVRWEIRPAIFPHFAWPNKKIHPKSALQDLGILVCRHRFRIPEFGGISALVAHEVRHRIGNGRNTVSRVLFRRRELTEPQWVLGQTRWVLRKNSVSSLFFFHTNNRLRETHWVRSPELSEPKKTHRVRCLKPYSPKPYSARFRQKGVLRRGLWEGASANFPRVRPL